MELTNLNFAKQKAEAKTETVGGKTEEAISYITFKNSKINLPIIVKSTIHKFNPNQIILKITFKDYKTIIEPNKLQIFNIPINENTDMDDIKKEINRLFLNARNNKCMHDRKARLRKGERTGRQKIDYYKTNIFSTLSTN
jgi:hypothetical protein